MQPLADICKTLFERYRVPISNLSITQVQRYFRWNQNPRFEHLYDLRHMLQQAGATEAELAQFDAALKKCVLYEAHTERFMSLWLTNVCGLSVYLPSSGDDDLNQYYMNQVEWNNATELIK